MTRQQQPPPPQREPLEAPFARLLGISLVEARPGWAKLRMPIQQKHLHSGGAVQGGLTVSLADCAFSQALDTLLRPGEDSTTVELKVNFLRPAMGKELVAEGNILHKGRRLVVGEMAVRDEKGRLVATGLGTCAIIRGGSAAASSEGRH